MSPSDAEIYVDNIAKALAALDPTHRDLYFSNAAAYKAQIREAVAPIRTRLAAVPEKQRWLVTSEGAFSYLARDFGLKELYLWPINADQQGTPQQMRKAIDTIRQNHIQAIFSESTTNPDPAKQIAAETGARYGGVLYVDSLTGSDGPAPTYLEMLKTTTATIVKGLTQ
jgi:manganese/iron transport system substrate-binding protein